jgi:hypothetical protein
MASQRATSLGFIVLLSSQLGIDHDIFYLKINPALGSQPSSKKEMRIRYLCSLSQCIDGHQKEGRRQGEQDPQWMTLHRGLA